MSGISSRDQKFIRQTIQQEISKRKIEILKACEDPGIRSFVVGLDYTNVPVRMTCGSMETFRPHQYADKLDDRQAWDALLDSIQGRTDTLVVSSHMAAGATEKSFVQFVPMESFRADGALLMMKAF